MAQAKPIVNVTLSTPGSAGSIWRAAIASLDPSLRSGFDLHWIAGDPGQMQVQLAAGALDVGLFGAIGLATIARKGSDITLFGPGLNNHGRIIVRSDSPYRKPADLVGKRIATQPKTTKTYQQARVALSLVGVDMDRDFETFFGPPTANLALFDRGDVEAVIVVEPTATRAVGAGPGSWRRSAISGIRLPECAQSLKQAPCGQGVPKRCPISPICFQASRHNGSTPDRAAFSPASAARDRP